MEQSRYVSALNQSILAKRPLELYQRGTPFGNCGIPFIQMLLLKMPVPVVFNRKQKFQAFLANYIKEKFC